MNKYLKYILIGVIVVILVLAAAGPILNSLGVELFCITNENGRLAINRCGGAPTLTADTNPPIMASDARPILIDTDMAPDDWMAILYLLQRPDVDVQAITVSGTGIAHCDPGVQNALDLAAFAGRPGIPVACGLETPLQGDHFFPDNWREDADSLLGIAIPTNPQELNSQSAMTLILDAIEDAGGNLEIIALGPLTNLAELLLEDPSQAENIQHIYIMGGAFEVPGNISDAPELGIDNSVAEWNIYADPYAANIVFAASSPVTLLPLDASNHVLLDELFYELLEANRSTPEAEFVYQVLSENIGFVSSGDYYFWDPLTAAMAVDESLVTLMDSKIDVVTEEGPESGATIFTDTGHTIRIATKADGDRFKNHFLDVLNGRNLD